MDVVDWAGVRLTEDKVQPLRDHVRVIRDFPTPTNITGWGDVLPDWLAACART